MFIQDENDLETAIHSSRQRNRNMKIENTRDTIENDQTQVEEPQQQQLGDIRTTEQINRWKELVAKNNNADDLISVEDQEQDE